MTHTLKSSAKETAKTILKHFAEKKKCKECGSAYCIIPSGVQPYMSSEVKKMLSLKTDWAFEEDEVKDLLFCEHCLNVRKN
jgi:hypothetical protein